MPAKYSGHHFGAKPRDSCHGTTQIQEGEIWDLINFKVMMKISLSFGKHPNPKAIGRRSSRG